MLYIRKNRTQAVREVPQTNPRGKVFCGGSAVWSDCKRCDASRISGIGKRMVQRNTDKEILTIERMNIRVKNRIIRKQKKRQPMTIMRQCYRQPMRQL